MKTKKSHEHKLNFVKIRLIGSVAFLVYVCEKCGAEVEKEIDQPEYDDPLTLL